MKEFYWLLAVIVVGVLIGTAARPWDAVMNTPRITSPTDTLHTRPLRYLMVGLGQEMSRINDGFWHEDYEMIADGAQGIADHARVTAEEMAAIKQALGDRFGSFVGFDQSVHLNATELVGAAENQDMRHVLEVHGRLQQGCISCHATFRDEVRAALY